MLDGSILRDNDGLQVGDCVGFNELGETVGVREGYPEGQLLAIPDGSDDGPVLELIDGTKDGKIGETIVGNNEGVVVVG